MATRTLRLGGYEGETIVTSLDYDDITGNVLAIRCVNGSGRTVQLTVGGTGSGPAGRTRTGTFNPGTTVISIPAGQQPQFPLVTTGGVPEIGGYTVTFV